MSHARHEHERNTLVQLAFLCGPILTLGNDVE